MNIDPSVLYEALIADGGRVNRLHRLQYRCQNDARCLLLDAIEVPAPELVLLHQKRYKHSETVNERRSNEAGRAANTFDGRTHWRPRTYYIGQSALAYPDDSPTPRISLDCDHLLDVTLDALAFRHDWNACHAEVKVRGDGTRYAVR